jgi:hypothetical protein
MLSIHQYEKIRGEAPMLSVIHPPTRKFEAKLLLASGLENF